MTCRQTGGDTKRDTQTGRHRHRHKNKTKGRKTCKTDALTS